MYKSLFSYMTWGWVCTHNVACAHHLACAHRLVCGYHLVRTHHLVYIHNVVHALNVIRRFLFGFSLFGCLSVMHRDIQQYGERRQKSL